MIEYVYTWSGAGSLAVIIIVAAIVVDLIIGDPRWLPHPVVQIGRFISFIEKRLNNRGNRKAKGVALTAIVIVSVFFMTYTVVFLAYQLHPIVGIWIEVYFISTTIAIKGLRSAALHVYIPLVDGDLQQARVNLSMIVGRDTKALAESEVVRGTVETVAENTVDGITAPLFWAIIGGAPLAMVYRAINTLDSMVGYKNERFSQFGWASARLDDVVNWLPARVTAVSIWVSSFFFRGGHSSAWKVTWRDARKHPSPNSGWPEAMVAGLIGVQLGGVNFYHGVKSERATMGDPLRKLVSQDIKKAILYMHGGWLFFLLTGVVILLFII
ncbi:adenosylcobinamide-phosphate synthase CbiB [Alteribacter populi]|uniref:adenosylcobinamide-phosphate synthase CbiB n=1 Tax=Alteribacter populi TaxID=2011011 RepID=UPI000BBB314C|nr:adenosylcobinamide-phosphate synthase CbiB [Alteribacter populi]